MTSNELSQACKCAPQLVSYLTSLHQRTIEPGSWCRPHPFRETGRDVTVRNERCIPLYRSQRLIEHPDAGCVAPCCVPSRGQRASQEEHREEQPPFPFLPAGRLRLFLSRRRSRPSSGHDASSFLPPPPPPPPPRMPKNETGQRSRHLGRRRRRLSPSRAGDFSRGTRPAGSDDRRLRAAERLAAAARLLSSLQNGARVREGPIGRSGNVQPCRSAQKADCERACALYFAIVSRME
ncbi:hypothetical protein ISCGN_030651 [Ixodes scapularis]